MTDPDPQADVPSLREAYRRHQQGDVSGAAQLYQRIVAQDPAAAPAWHLWGLAEHQLGRPAQAIGLLTRALSLDPSQPVYYNHFGAALQASGRAIEALACFQHAAALDPTYVEAQANVSVILERLGHLDLALPPLRRALELAPERIDLLRRMARLLVALGRPAEAIDLYREGLARSPENAALQSELGNVWLGMNQLEEATAALQSAVALDPRLAGAWFNLGQALAQQDLLEAADQAFRKAVELRPDARPWSLRRELLCPPVFADREALAAYHEELERKLVAGVFDLSGVALDELLASGFRPPFSLSFHGRHTRAIKEKFAALVRPLIPRFPMARRSGKPRVGIVVTRGHEKLFLRCSGGIVDRLDRQEFDVSVLASQACLPELREKLQNPRTTYVPLPEQIEPAMETLAAAACDALYHWEVGSDDANYLLAFAAAAPVQCTSWGTQVTSGVAEIGYYLSSRWIELPTADEHYTEQLWRLDSLPTWQRRIAPPPATDKAYFGWSEQQHIYLCPQTLLKIHPDQDALFLRLLEADPQALVVLKQQRYPESARLLQARLARRLGKLAARVVFAPWLSLADYQRLICVADVVLDAVYYTAGSSCYDMFSFDQLLVTLPGEFNVGRYTQACYRRMGMSALIAADEDDYVRLAMRVASDGDFRRQMRAQLRERTDVLFEDESAVAAHADFFRQAIEKSRREA